MTPYAATRTVTAAPGSTNLFIMALALLSTVVIGSTVVDSYRRVERRCMDIFVPWIYVLLPGVALHELAHAVVGRRYADVVEINWEIPRVRFDDWRDPVPIWGIVGTLLAPLIAGGLAAFALAVVVPLVPPFIGTWLALNWLLLAGPSVVDVLELATISSRGRSI